MSATNILPRFFEVLYRHLIFSIPKPVWAVGFALEQTLRDATLAVFSFANFKTASAYFVFFRICIVFRFVESLLIRFLRLRKLRQHN
ncbi:MAG: hypothetical protein LBH59_11130 [Planctomycetaceae bacterium]|nr:hypothetical protein [Planctomycetaceae bacterium]